MNECKLVAEGTGDCRVQKGQIANEALQRAITEIMHVTYWQP